MLKLNTSFVAAVVGAVLGLSSVAVGAAKLKAGDVINASNLDSIKNDRFEGKTIASMLPERIEWMIREQGLTMTLRNSEEVPKDPRWIEATKKYSGGVKFDPKTRLISGYKAGLPFPNVGMNDPYAGVKLIWNHNRSGGYPRGNIQDYPLFAFLFVDDKKGIEREQHWALIRQFMQGRLDGDPVRDKDVYFKQLLFAHYPQDIRGIGTYTVRHVDGRLDDSYVYLRTVRRTRRLSGGTWADPIGGTDQLNDEVEVMSAHATWYPKYKLLGKRWMLAVAHSRFPPWIKDKKTQQEQFPNLDLSNPPYWNPLDDWEPREVYVIEATPPEEHPYSKKIMYLDAKTWVMYFGEMYDKKGEYWKSSLFLMRPVKAQDGGWALLSNQGHTIDYQRRHATIFVHERQSKFNTQGIDDNYVSRSVLEQAGRGRFNVNR